MLHIGADTGGLRRRKRVPELGESTQRAAVVSVGTMTETIVLDKTTTDTAPEIPGGLSARELQTAAQQVAAEAAALVIRTRRERTAGTPAGGSIIELMGSAMPVAETKSSDVDPVTEADRKAESFIRDWLHERFPFATVLGEEEGADAAAPVAAEGAAEGPQLQWVVDPIDGTVNFVYGIPAFSVSVAAAVDGIPVAGAVVDVAHSHVFGAHAGGPATVAPVDLRADEPVIGPERDISRQSGADSLAGALVATGFSYEADRRARQAQLLTHVLPRVRDIRRLGSAALDLCMLASGQADAYFEHGLNAWDFAAGALIAARAGARVVTPALEFVSADGLPIIAGVSGVQKELEKLLLSVGAGGSIENLSIG